MHHKIAIRVDASNIIGSGHVYRCLVLAEELKRQKAEPVFICQKFESDLINFINAFDEPYIGASTYLNNGNFGKLYITKTIKKLLKKFIMMISIF